MRRISCKYVAYHKYLQENKLRIIGIYTILQITITKLLLLLLHCYILHRWKSHVWKKNDWEKNSLRVYITKNIGCFIENCCVPWIVFLAVNQDKNKITLWKCAIMCYDVKTGVLTVQYFTASSYCRLFYLNFLLHFSSVGAFI